MITAKAMTAATWMSSLGLLPFTLVIAVSALLSRLILVPIFLLAGMQPSGSVPAMDVSPWIAMVVGPMVETFLFQVAPIQLALWLRAPRWLQVMASTTVFALAHYPGGALAVAVAFTGGLAFAWAYLRWRQVSATKGVLAAFLTHFWVNAAVYAIALVLT